LVAFSSSLSSSAVLVTVVGRLDCVNSPELMNMLWTTHRL